MHKPKFAIGNFDLARLLLLDSAASMICAIASMFATHLADLGHKIDPDSANLLSCPR